MQPDKKGLHAKTQTDKRTIAKQDSQEMEQASDHEEREALLSTRPPSPGDIVSRAPKDSWDSGPTPYRPDFDMYVTITPPYRCNTVLVIFLYLGVATLLPWNFVITAKQYFDFKFRNTSLPANVSYSTGNSSTHLQTNFESYLSSLSMTSNLIFLSVATVVFRKISLNGRILGTLVPVILIFIATMVFIDIDTDSWQVGFFWLSLISAALMVGLTAVMTGSVFGMSNLFPHRYTTAVMAGQAVGGTLSAAVNIVAIAIGGDPRRSAFGYFLTATLCSIFALFAYFALFYLKFSKFYMSERGRPRQAGKVQPVSGDVSVQSQDANNDIYRVNAEIPNSRQLTSTRHFLASILKEIWPYFLSMFLVFFVTLSCFPAVISLISSVNYKPGDPWTDTYFSPVVCFLLFNVCDLIGRTVIKWLRFPRSGQTGAMLVLAFLRVAFIPLFMLCNISPPPHKSRNLPILLNNDAWPAVLTVALGLTNGYIGSLCMRYAPDKFPLAIGENSHMAEGTGMVMTYAMTLGLAGGSFFSLLVVKLV